MNAERVFIDTNVLTYLFDSAEGDKQKRAERVLAEETREVFVSTQVLQELYVSLTKGKSPITTSDVAEQAVREASKYSVVHIDPALVFSAIEVARKHKISFWDALIVGAAARAECGAVLSEDLNAGQIIEGVHVENPFARGQRKR
jgi:predicted nucleic acid-binding protein